MSEVNSEGKKHPKDTDAGAIAWARPTCYVVGDRVRKTVLFITPDLVIEMTPQYAEELAGEMSHHATNVRGLSDNGSTS